MDAKQKYSILLLEHSAALKKKQFVESCYLKSCNLFESRLKEVIAELEEPKSEYVNSFFSNESGQEDSEPEQPETISKEAKKLYKRLAIKTHPDKVGDALKDVFTKVNNSYKNNDIHSLRMYCDLLSLEYDHEPTEKDCEDLHHKINHINMCVNNMETSWAYVWNLKKDDNIIFEFIRSTIE